MAVMCIAVLFIVRGFAQRRKPHGELDLFIYKICLKVQFINHF